MTCCGSWIPVVHGLVGRPPPLHWVHGLCLLAGALSCLATRLLILVILHINAQQLISWGGFIYHLGAGGQTQQQIQKLGDEHVGTHSCQTLTVLAGESGELIEYQRMGTSYRGMNEDSRGLLRWTSRGWVVIGSHEDFLRMDTPHNLHGNITYYYFCNTVPPLWYVPFVVWAGLVLLPSLLIPLFLLLCAFRCRERQLFCNFFLWSTFSPLTAGPLSCSLRSPSHLSLSKTTSVLDLCLLSFSSVITLVVSVPLDSLSIALLSCLLISVFFTSISLYLFSPLSCCCCTNQEKSTKLLVLDLNEPDKTCYKFTAKL